MKLLFDKRPKDSSSSRSGGENHVQQQQTHPWIYRSFVLSPAIDGPFAFARTKSPSPFPRYGHSLSASDPSVGELYLFGGQLRQYARPGNDLYIFNIRKSSAALVRTKGKVPSIRVGSATATIRKKLVLWGGSRGTLDLDDTLYSFDIVSRIWSTVPVTGSTPVGRYGHATCVARETQFLVIGGQVTDGVFLNDLWSVNLADVKAEATWQLMQPASKERPNQRAGHVCVFHENRLIIFGGSDGLCKYNDTWSFDFETRKWSEWTCDGQVPEPRDGHAAAVVDGIMYIFGGYSIGGEELGDVFALALSSQIWYSFQNHDMGCPPGERLGHAMVSVGPEIYVLGGRSGSLPLSIAMESPNYMHVLDTRRLSLEYSD
ncbi:hypothetical protein VKT23_005059 [Stygiomarasmius scandens]|uniref:Kelch repeat-containing protein n=1 Tax=Marasmiellus scandens TaxID=2682957 RepID=A0ABR1JYI5_9AGAR